MIEMSLTPETTGRSARWLRLVALGVVAGFVFPGGIARAADAEAGGRIAERWCAECHVVAPNQKKAKADVPSFREIVRRRGNDEVALLSFLMNPHPKMPDMQITRREAADLVAYMKSMRGK